MERQELETYVNMGLSLAGISAKCGKSKTSIRHWLNKHQLTTNKKITQLGSIFVGKICKRCDTHKPPSDFYLRRDGTNLSPYCKPCSVDQTTERQRKLKMDAVAYKGGCCNVCKYDKCINALEFHHIDPSQKDFTISQVKSYKFDDKLKKELDKCTLLCSNCHRETHFLLFNQLEI